MDDRGAGPQATESDPSAVAPYAVTVIPKLMPVVPCEQLDLKANAVAAKDGAMRFAERLCDNRFTRPIKRSVIRSIAAKKWPRFILNCWYEFLGDEAKSRFHSEYAKVFRDRNVHLANGEWCVCFNGRKIRLPLRASWSWLDWDNALSIVGHDIAIKQTYAAIIASRRPPTLFLDVGANYGMHSTIFMSAGIRTIAFEPNPTCLSCFAAVCELNGLSGQWEQVALGNKSGEIELTYPERDTWLGSVSSEVIADLRCRDDVRKVLVSQKKLDDYLGDVCGNDVVMKVDVEGSEGDVIKGASQILKECKPKVIFETNDAKARRELFAVLQGVGYVIYTLPWRPFACSDPLDGGEFANSTDVNFIAIAS